MTLPLFFLPAVGPITACFMAHPHFCCFPAVTEWFPTVPVALQLSKCVFLVVTCADSSLTDD